MRTVTVALMAILLVSSASIAHAECAWVLWTKTMVAPTELTTGRDVALALAAANHPEAGRWIVLRGYGTEQSCREEESKRFSGLVETFSQLHDNFGAELIVRDLQGYAKIVGENSIEVWVQCLPVGVDPR